MQRVAQLERPVALDSTEDDPVVTASANLLQSVDTKASDSRTQKVAPLEGEKMASYLKRRDEEPAKSDLDEWFRQQLDWSRRHPFRGSLLKE